ncbi:hypothetical protein K466DRAFT_588244 [Polyporus arcularius HHB13444]|uniref:Uncharacterized protein n=1 Tax=Polyporus arcularius HHB13444 TaxID=1314778 RepID=A0A5C3PAP2_9APHY|nr:hypothetical protein K466DRAFT_588244 [Polyporus arcularius HHB13444]
MFAGLSLDKRGLHRRLTGGLKRVNKRVYTPTAIFTHEATTTDIITPPAAPTTTADPNTITPVDTNTVTSSSTTVSITIPGVTNTLSGIGIPVTVTTSTSETPVLPSTTSTSTSTTPPPTTPPVTTSSSTPVRAPTTLPDATTEVRVTVTSTPAFSHSQSATQLAASPTSSTTATSGSSTGVVIGGVVAAIVAVAGIVFAVIFFVRRSRRNSDDDDGNDFDPDAFRRQSMMLPQDGGSGSGSGMARAMTYSRGGARPPTMIEQKLAHGPVSYNPTPMPSHPYGHNSYNTFAPGQVMTPTTVNSANPFFSSYAESPMASPVSSVPVYESAYDARGNPVSRAPSNASTPVLSRHTSTASNKPLPEPAVDAQYVDMSRSSVTPFQAAQYAEISRRLNTTPPQPLPLSAVAEEFDHTQEVAMPAHVQQVEPLELQPQISFDEGQRLTGQPTPRESSFPESPFADPNMPNMAAVQSQYIQKRDSTDSFLQAPEPSFTTKERITSIPPTLPDLQIEARPFSPVSLDFPVAPSSVHATPSPFSTTFSIPTPPPNAHFAAERVPEPVAEPAPAATARPRVPAAQRPDTVYTMYDEEDAYAGI